MVTYFSQKYESTVQIELLFRFTGVLTYMCHALPVITSYFDIVHNAKFELQMC